MCTDCCRLSIILLILFVCGCSDAKPEANVEGITTFDLIRGRIVDSKVKDCLSDTTYSDKVIERLLNIQSEDGSWKDIDYSSQEAAAWEPHYHLDRCLVLGVGLVNEKSNYYKNEKIKEAIKESLRFWVESKPTCTNWWWTIIGEPQRIGLLLNILLEGGVHISDDLSNALIDRFPESDPFDYGGANRSDVGIANLYKYLYVENEEGLKTSLDAIFSSIEYGDDSSFQDDGTYFESGSQLYIGGYAEVLLSNTLRFAEYVQGTDYSISKEKIDIMSDYVRGVYSSTIRGKVMAFNCHGRSVSREDQLDKSTSVSWIKKLKGIDSTNESEYDALISRLTEDKAPDYSVKEQTHHYYKGDFTVQATKDYNIAVRMLSTRTRRDEIENSENLKGYFICDGSTCIARTGKEYYNIMPLWDWLHIPGTTVPELADIPQSYFMQKGVSSFCGGVSDSEWSVACLDYYDPYNGVNTGGRKAYFLINDMMVCLGTSLVSDNSFHTTVNQCWSSDEGISLKLNNIKETIGGSAEVDKKYRGSYGWVLHEHIGYIFPAIQDIRVKSNQRSGRWYDINQGFGSDKIQNGRVFQLSIEHTNNSKYRYIVKPNVSEQELILLANDLPVTIVNTDQYQAVYDKRVQKYGIVFYEIGEISIEGICFSVSHPCVIIAERKDDQMLSVSVADPSQSLNDLTLSVRTYDGRMAEKEVAFNSEIRGKAESFKLLFAGNTGISHAHNGQEKVVRYALSGQRLVSTGRISAPFVEVINGRGKVYIKR